MRLLQYINEKKEQFKQWQEYISSNPMLAAAVKVLQKINDKGYKAYIVGGAVRDIVMGIEPHDVDICTNMPIDEISKQYKIYDIGKSKNFGVVVIKENGYDFEVTQFRSDGKYLDGRRPESIAIVGSFKEDASRRDFSFNALAINAKGEIIDYFDGRRDIKNKVLRTVGNPYERFGEDKLRILRAVRFSSKLGFDIEKETGKAMKKMSGEVVNISPERIRDEIMKAASQSGDKFARYIELLDKYGILKHILPHVKNLQFYRENLTHHPETVDSGGTVWAHTMKALRMSDTIDPIKNIALLIHDIGKGVTYSNEGGVPHYYEHEKRGVELVKELAERLKMSNKDRDALMFAVANHMNFGRIKEMKPSKIFKLVSDNNWDVLVAVARCDDYVRGEHFMNKRVFDDCLEIALKVKEKWGKEKLKKSMKFVDGYHVMNLLNIGPSKKVGEIIKQTTEWILDTGNTDQESIDNYIRKNWI